MFYGEVPNNMIPQKRRDFQNYAQPMGLNRFQYVIPFAQEYTKPNGFVAFDHNAEIMDPNIS